jgi:hypothetical protein
MDSTLKFRERPPSKVIELPSHLVAEIEAVLADSDIESFVYRAIRTYTATIRHEPESSQLAADYDKLATIYDELAAELADEVWLPLENEALLQLEEKVGA